MKKILIILLSIAMLCGCTKKVQEPKSEAPKEKRITLAGREIKVKKIVLKRGKMYTDEEPREGELFEYQKEIVLPRGYYDEFLKILEDNIIACLDAGERYTDMPENYLEIEFNEGDLLTINDINYYFGPVNALDLNGNKINGELGHINFSSKDGEYLLVAKKDIVPEILKYME